MYIHNFVNLPEPKRIDDASGRYYLTPEGRKYPSVTSVLGVTKNESIEEWKRSVGMEEANKISRRACNRGTRVHHLAEKHLLNEELQPDLCDYEVWKKLKPKLSSINNIRALETPLYSDHLEVAGTVDCIAEFNGKLSVIDFKTSSRQKHKEEITSYFLQCSAYAVAFEELTGMSVPLIQIIIVDEFLGVNVYEEKRNRWIEQFKELRREFKKCAGY